MFHLSVEPSPVPPPIPPVPQTPCPKLGEILAAAIAAEGGTLAETLSPNRNRAATRSRQAAMWLAFKLTSHSLPAIGRAFGRHHSTVLYGIRAYERHLAGDREARTRSERLLTHFLAQHKEEGTLQ